MTPVTGKVQYKQINPLRIASIRSDISDRSQIRPLFEKLYHYCKDVAAGPAFALFYHDSGGKELDVEVCVPVNHNIESRDIHTRLFPGGTVLSLVFQGSQERLREGYIAIASWAIDHAVNVENLSREIYISSDHENPAENLTEVQIFVVDWEQRLAVQVEKTLGSEACLAVMRDWHQYNTQIGADQRSLWVHSAVGTLDRLTGKEDTYEIISRCAHTFSSRRISELREIYQETGDVDKVLEVMNAEPDWYENPERQGRIIYVTKIPANRQQYDEAVSRNERRQAYCHCALAYRHLDTMPPAFCNCGAGWYRQLWEGILQKPISVEIIKSLTCKDDTCRFAIHLPPSVRINS
ncbi:MAG: GyrI-like domain-containing protein [Anaerolineales bacterium]|nr:GyrI-like domain-containing protein [Anaerolineales bacterium]